MLLTPTKVFSGCICLQNTPIIMMQTYHQSRRSETIILDFSPMAALGFMLIAFFMVNANLKKPSVMPLVMPEGCWEDNTCVCNPPILTLLCTSQKIYCYEGLTDARLDSTDYSAEGLRSLILRKMAKAEASVGLKEYIDPRTGHAEKASPLQVAIKLAHGARYGNLVDVIDEMRICRVAYYSLLDISKEEQQFIQHPDQGLFVCVGN